MTVAEMMRFLGEFDPSADVEVVADLDEAGVSLPSWAVTVEVGVDGGLRWPVLRSGVGLGCVANEDIARLSAHCEGIKGRWAYNESV